MEEKWRERARDQSCWHIPSELGLQPGGCTKPFGLGVAHQEGLGVAHQALTQQGLLDARHPEKLFHLFSTAQTGSRSTLVFMYHVTLSLTLLPLTVVTEK